MDNKKKSLTTLIKSKKNICELIIILITYVCILNVTKIGCPFNFLFGIPCMGCGMTRACLAFLQGDILMALKYHPMVILLPLILLLFITHIILNNNKKNIKIIMLCWLLIIILFCVIYLIRLLIIKDPIIKIQIKDGIIYKILYYIIFERG